MKPQFRPGDQAGEQPEESDAPLHDATGIKFPTQLYAILIFTMLIAVAAAGYGLLSLMNTRHFLATAQPATGVVVRVDTRVVAEPSRTGTITTTRDVPHYFPVVEFRTARGQVARFQFDNGSRLDNAREGDSVRLLYDPANPSHARVDTWKGTWANGFAATATGLGLLVGGGGVYLLLRRWARQADAGGPVSRIIRDRLGLPRPSTIR